MRTLRVRYIEKPSAHRVAPLWDSKPNLGYTMPSTPDATRGPPAHLQSTKRSRDEGGPTKLNGTYLDTLNNSTKATISGNFKRLNQLRPHRFVPPFKNTRVSPNYFCVSKDRRQPVLVRAFIHTTRDGEQAFRNKLECKNKLPRSSDRCN